MKKNFTMNHKLKSDPRITRITRIIKCATTNSFLPPAPKGELLHCPENEFRTF